MQKVWQWIRDRKTNTIRKWRSTFGVSNNAGPSGDQNDGQYCESLLDVPDGGLQPIGGSDNALSRLRSEKIRQQQRSFFGRISRRLSPRNKSKKDFEESDALLIRSMTNGSLEHDNQNFLDSKKLFDSVHQCVDENPTTSEFIATPPVVKKKEKQILSDSLEDVLQTDRDKMANELFQHTVSTSKLTKKRDAKSQRERKRTRFVIPHVSVSSFDEPTYTTTVLYPSSDYKEEYLGEENLQEEDDDDLLEMDIPEMPNEEKLKEEVLEEEVEEEMEAKEEPGPISSTRSTKSEISSEIDVESRETPPRRSVTDIDRRRISLQQRRLSNVQLVQSVSGRRNSTTLIPLTAAQIHLVRALWRQVYLTKGPTVIGQTIIHRLFFKCAKTKEQFKRCPMPRSFPNHDSFAKAHSKAIAELIDQVVENLDSLENMAGDLEKIGRVHAQIMGGQLSSKVWNTVAETFIDCTLEWGDRRCRSETVRKAWALIIAYIIERIKIGHVEQKTAIDDAAIECCLPGPRYRI